MTNREEDWELSDDYYSGREDKKDLSLEDFITESDTENTSAGIPAKSNELLKKTIFHVHQVLTLAQEGKSISEIVSITGLEEKYVYDIQVCAQGFREDDEIAVAYLMLG